MKLREVRMAIVAVAAVMVSAPALSHEMFLKSDTSFLKPNTKQVVRLINGTFDKSENAIPRDRMADVSVVGNGRLDKPSNGDWHDDDDSSYLNYRVGKMGTYVVGISTRPRIIEMSSEDFVGYLRHDGVLDTLATFKEKNKLSTVRERYSKHIRTLVQVGDKRTDDYSRELGYPVEILLDQNPYNLRFGQEVSFRILYKGKPVANQVVRASYEGFHGHDASGGHINSYDMRTDSKGRAKFLLNNKALWYISLIHMKKIDDDEADYESNWATATFRVK